MSAVALGRLLARRLAEEGGDPRRPVTVEEVRTRLVPYGLCRTELDLATKAEYDLALLGLLSEPELVALEDEDLEAAVGRELASPEPELAVLEAFGSALVGLGPELGGRRVRPRARSRRVDAGRSAVKAPPRMTPPAARAPEAATTAEEPAGVEERPDAEAEEVTTAAGEGHGSGCRSCGGELPRDREVRFCPHCGAEQGAPRCEGCGEELEIGWRYCPACGRAAGRDRKDG